MALERPQDAVVVEAETGRGWAAGELMRESGALAEAIAGWRPEFASVTQVIEGKALTQSSIEATARRGLGPTAGQRVAFCIPNSAAWVCAFLALQRLGIGAVPLDPSLPMDGGARLAAAQLAGAEWLMEIQPGAQSMAAPVLVRTSVISRKRLQTRRMRPVVVKLTSGSTGKPRQIPCTAGNMLADGSNIISTMGIRRDDVNIAVIPLGHSYGLGNLIMPLLMKGTRLVVAREFVPRQIAQWIAAYGVTVLPAVPAIFRALAGLPETRLAPPLRLAISAGAPLSPAIAAGFREAHGVAVHNFYGSSESGGICYDKTGDAPLVQGVAGTPLNGVRVSLSPAGRVVVESHAVALGRRRLSTARVQADAEVSGREHVASPATPRPTGNEEPEGPPRRYTLPDLGAWTEVGELRILGRSTAVANVGGKKVHPAEVERVLRGLEGVGDCWVGVVGRRSAGDDSADPGSSASDTSASDTRLAAAVETVLTRAELERRLGELLPEWKCPKAWLLREQLPRTTRGKLDTAAISRELGAEAGPGGQSAQL
ncbi:hypothetical protein DB346_04260 [Verrucomicrobia bacterium LW23]|nr:hypothetical protein DB346_04260 [Verrucomicrobia bacterium LW23]